MLNPSPAVLGMNLNKRELNEHVEFESQTYYAAFAAELEACAQPMWGLLTHCKVKVSHCSHVHLLTISNDEGHVCLQLPVLHALTV